MTWHLIKVQADSADGITRAFAWLLVLACGFWTIAIATLLWGVCS